MDKNRYGPHMVGTTKESGSMPDKKAKERARRERELIEKATEVAIEMYGPALKELEQS